MTTWTKGDDAAVCLSYRDHGVKATPELIAALSHLTPGSIGMRLQNVEYLATGARRLSRVAAQAREIGALVSAARIRRFLYSLHPIMVTLRGHRSRARATRR